jgi:hypothetical protein
MAGSILFVHGTGVRLKSFKATVEIVEAQASRAGITSPVYGCAWGDPLGVEFEGLSLPDPPDETELGIEEARWAWLLDDPLYELEKLAIRGLVRAVPPLPGQKPKWRSEFERIAAYRPTLELQILLSRGFAEEFWDASWLHVIQAPIVTEAFERSGEANELADCVGALARAVVAQLHVDALASGRAGISLSVREQLFDQLRSDWNYRVLGLGTFLASLAKRAATTTARQRRNRLNDAIARPIGDILLYQSRGQEIRSFIAARISQSPPPVTIVAHSLGGIACVDLLAISESPQVHALVTVGSQAPYFYELGVLASIVRPRSLPQSFPNWLNIFDRNDFLSFVGERVFPGRVRDLEVHSGEPFPDAHSAYVTNETVWSAIRRVCGP